MTSQVARHLVLDWASFVGELRQLPDPKKDDREKAQAGIDLLDKINQCVFPYEYLLTVPDAAFEAAHEILNEDSHSNAAMEQAHFLVDEEAWETLLHNVGRMVAQCDPSVGEEFL